MSSNALNTKFVSDDKNTVIYVTRMVATWHPDSLNGNHRYSLSVYVNNKSNMRTMFFPSKEVAVKEAEMVIAGQNDK